MRILRVVVVILAMLSVAGVASQSVAQAANTNVTASGVQVPPDHRYERYDPTRATYGQVKATDVPNLVEKKNWIYDRTDKVWVYRPAEGLNPRYAAGAPASGWQNVHGQVQSVSGSQMMLKADDGRTVTVDMAKIGSEIQQAMKPGTAVTVTGYQWSGPTQVRAEYIQQDSSAAVQPAAAAPAASPSSGPVDTSSWQKIHGQVQSVSGSTMTLKADDGRTLNVDMKDVGHEIQTSMSQGTPVTVTGFYTTDQNNVAAKYIQKDSSAK